MDEQLWILTDSLIVVFALSCFLFFWFLGRPLTWLPILQILLVGVMLFDVRVRILASVKLLVILALLLAVVNRFLITGKLRWKTHSLDWWIGCILVVSFLQAVRGAYLGYSVEKVATSIYVIAQPIVYYIVTRVTQLRDSDILVASKTFAIASIPLVVLGLTWGERFTVGPAVLGGYLSHVGLIFPLCVLAERSQSRLMIMLTLFLLLDVILGGARRYWLPAMFLLLVYLRSLKGRSYPVIMVLVLGIVVVLLVHEPTFNVVSDALTRGVGYRTAEYQVAYEYGIAEQPFLGLGFGAQTPVTQVGTKGIYRAGPVFHNYYLTILFNGGLVMLIPFIAFLCLSVLYAFRYAQRGGFMPKAILMLLVAWIVVANFDAPRDGHWLLGLLPGVVANTSKQRRRCD